MPVSRRFYLTEVVQRRAHFSYSDWAGNAHRSRNLNEKLRERLNRQKLERTRAREAFRGHAAQLISKTRCWLR